jgi:hypothetical protein
MRAVLVQLVLDPDITLDLRFGTGINLFNLDHAILLWISR